MTHEPGDIIAIRVLGVFWHLGIVTTWGTVILHHCFTGALFNSRWVNLQMARTFTLLAILECCQQRSLLNERQAVSVSLGTC